jgi:uncharacterized protein YjbI with pentapeptide repeats
MFSVLLFEASREALIKFYKDKFGKIFLSSDYTAQVNDLYQEGIFEIAHGVTGLDKGFNAFLDIIFSIDPTKTKDYVRWLVERWLSEGIILEDKDKIREYLELFHKHKQRLSIKDIGKIKSSGELFKVLKEAGVVGLGTSSLDPEQLKSLIASGDLEQVGEVDNNWLVFIPLTAKGSCYVGKDTEWCTAKYKPEDERNAFKHYSDDGPLWVFISTTNPGSKIQIHMNSSQIMDENDEEISPEQLEESFPEIIQFLKDKFSSGYKGLTKFDLMENFWTEQETFEYLRSKNIDPSSQAKYITGINFSPENWNGIVLPKRSDTITFFKNCSFTDIVFAKAFSADSSIQFINCKIDNCSFEQVYYQFDLGFTEKTTVTNCRFDNMFSLACSDWVRFINCEFIHNSFSSFEQGTSFNNCSFKGSNIEGSLLSFTFYYCKFYVLPESGFKDCSFKECWFDNNLRVSDQMFIKCNIDTKTRNSLDLLREGYNNNKSVLVNWLFS